MSLPEAVTGLLSPCGLTITARFQAVRRQFFPHQLYPFIRFYMNKSHIHKHSCNFRATIVT